MTLTPTMERQDILDRMTQEARGPVKDNIETGNNLSVNYKAAEFGRIEKQAQAQADMITEDCVATADASTLTMEWTGFGSWVVPVCVVTGEVTNGSLTLTARTGPGREELSGVWRRAFVIATERRIAANAAARRAAERSAA